MRTTRVIVLLVANIIAFLVLMAIGTCNNRQTKQENSEKEIVAERETNNLKDLKREINSNNMIIGEEGRVIDSLNETAKELTMQANRLADQLNDVNLSNAQREALVDSLARVISSLRRSRSAAYTKWVDARERFDARTAPNPEVKDCTPTKIEKWNRINEAKEKIKQIADKGIRAIIGEVNSLTGLKKAAKNNNTVRYFNVKYTVSCLPAGVSKTVYLSVFFEVGAQKNLVDVPVKIEGVKQPSDNSGYAIPVTHSGRDSVFVAIDGEKKSSKYRFAIVTSSYDDVHKWNEQRKQNDLFQVNF